MPDENLNIDELLTEDDSYLTCKICGYKLRNDYNTDFAFKSLFPKLTLCDMPYYCGACQDNMSNKQLRQAQDQMSGKNQKG